MPPALPGDGYLAQSKQSTPSLGVRLLADLRQVFGNRDSMPTDTIIKSLCAMEEAPWADIRGKPVDARGIANRLKPYGIQSKNLRDGADVLKGYARADMLDAWQRYLPLPQRESATSATSATAPAAAPAIGPSVAPVAHVAAPMRGEPSDDAEFM